MKSECWSRNRQLLDNFAPQGRQANTSRERCCTRFRRPCVAALSHPANIALLLRNRRHHLSPGARLVRQRVAVHLFGRPRAPRNLPMQDDRVKDQSGLSCAGLCPGGYFCPRDRARTPVPMARTVRREAQRRTLPERDVLSATNLIAEEECVTARTVRAVPRARPRPRPAVWASLRPTRGWRVWCVRWGSSKTNEEPAATRTKGAYCRQGAAAPVSCHPGTVGLRPGLKAASECEPSPLGHWAGDGTAVACLPGFYQPYAGATSQAWCIICPAYSTTLAPAATSEENCVCKEGYYHSMANGSHVECRSCPVGTDCRDTVGSTILTCRSAWFLRPSAWSIDIRRCSTPAPAAHRISAARTAPGLSGRSRSERSRARLRAPLPAVRDYGGRLRSTTYPQARRSRTARRAKGKTPFVITATVAAALVCSVIVSSSASHRSTSRSGAPRSH